MFYVYVLKSSRDEKLYIGYTSDLKKRFSEHNNGESISTRYRTPLALLYYEAYTSQADAKDRETNLKRFAGAQTALRRRIPNCLRQGLFV